ncbi:MAG TPA: hypothetical protein VN726_22910 [Hanamia sp.]|nr:hypothetical protein [Hanamia sp.]
MNIKCFFIEPSGMTKVYARRYSSGSNCVKNGYHDSQLFVGEFPTIKDPQGWRENIPVPEGTVFPTHCQCGYEFTGTDNKQSFNEEIYICKETGERMTLRAAKVGAIWRAWWYEDVEWLRGIDGKSYVCQTPGGEWNIDSRASNCTKPNDLVHKCWCRHGEAPNFTVNKNGNTCSAGAGSIAIGNYHGFLINGELTNC